MKHLVGAGSVLALALLLLLAVGDGTRRGAAYDPGTPEAVTDEPAGAAAFARAIGRGDEDAAAKVASPLYRAERERRGLTRPDRRAPPADSPSPIAFAFAAAVWDGAGFGHVLYLATPVGQDDAQPIAPSVWRVDTDPRGRVIWAELVWLFSRGARLTTTVGHSATPDARVPVVFRSWRPVVLVRIQATTTPEQYEVIRIGETSQPLGTRDEGGTLIFYGIDEEGGFRPGAWSYGQTAGMTLAYGQPRPSPTPRSEPIRDHLQLAYLASLSRVP